MKKSARMLAAAMAAVMMLTACGSGSAGSTTAAPAGDSKAAETQAEAGTEAKESGAAEGEKAGADGVLKVALILPGKKTTCPLTRPCSRVCRNMWTPTPMRSI